MSLSRTLRRYQKTAVREIRKAFRSHRRVLFTLPTGAGKTVVAEKVAKALGLKTLFLAHRLEILNQAPKWMVVRSVQSREPIPADIGLIIIDEAHRASAKTYRAIVAGSPNAKILGLTATPERGDGRGLIEDWDDLVRGASAAELIRDGFLADPRVLTVPERMLPDLAGLKKGRDGDYEIAALSARCRVLVGDVVDHWQRHAKDRPTVVFAVDVEHAKALRKAFAKAGIAAEHLDGDTPKALRASVLARLRAGVTKVVTNCLLLTEGWDYPELECVIIARPTTSRTLYIQIAGRAMRPSETRPLILDHTGQALWWSAANYVAPELTAEKQKRGGGSGRAPCRRCEGCDEVIPAVARTCPECGFEVEGLLVVDGELEEASGLFVCACGEAPTSRNARYRAARERTWQCPRCSWAALRDRQNPNWRALEQLRQAACAGGCGRVPIMKQVRLHLANHGEGPWQCIRCTRAARAALLPKPPKQAECVGGCGRPTGAWAMTAGVVRLRNGKPWLCGQCTRDAKAAAKAEAAAAAKAEAAAAVAEAAE